MYNKVLIIGSLTKDPQGRFLPSGRQVAEFSIAYNRIYRTGDGIKEKTYYFDVKAYGKLAERVLSSVSKGYTVLIEGRLTQDRWIDSEGKSRSKVYITALDIRILRKPKYTNIIEEEYREDKDTFFEDIESTEDKEKIFGEDDEIPF